MAKTSIEWTDATWNPVAGCTIVTAGCTNCYAMRMAARLEAMGVDKYAGTTRKSGGRAKWTGKIVLDHLALNTPATWAKPRRVFVNSMSDLFHEDVPEEFIRTVWLTMAATPRHTYQILTKRPDRMAEVVSCLPVLPNVWLGTSVENNAVLARIDELRLAPAAVRFISFEPLIGSVADADRPYRFLQRAGAPTSHTIMIPRPASKDRDYLPVDVKDHTNITSSEAFGIFDGEIWQAAILSSRLHRLWLETVGGRLKEDPRYSNTLVWNTFPVPSLSDRRKADLEEHWWAIDEARKEAGFGRSLGDLYVPRTMPRPLRQAHEDLDETMETIFGSRRYRSDADRIEHMLQLYARMTAGEPKPSKIEEEVNG